MTEQNNGGPAFPCDELVDQYGNLHRSEGMSLRDYFAAKAMDQLIAGAVKGNLDYGNEHSVAKRAYEFADAMLEARK